MDIETFKKVLPLHMQIVDTTLERKMKRIDEIWNISTERKDENEVLWDTVQFLIDKLNDIKIDSIRHGLLSEDDYKRWSEGVE